MCFFLMIISNIQGSSKYPNEFGNIAAEAPDLWTLVSNWAHGSVWKCCFDFIFLQSYLFDA